MAGRSREGGRTVSSKVAAILLALTNGRGHTASSLARQTALPVSTVHRLLVDLAASPVVERSIDREYRPGPGLRHVACTPVAPTLFSHGPLVMDDLSAALQLTVRLGVRQEREIAYIEKNPGFRPGTSFPNRSRLPLHATALGKALLAFAPATLVQLVAVGGLPGYTPRTLTNIDDLRRALILTRRRGFATCEHELAAALCAVAVPVFDSTCGPIAAIEVLVPNLSAEFLAHITPSLMVAAGALGRELDVRVGSDRAARPLRAGTGADEFSHSPLSPQLVERGRDEITRSWRFASPAR